MFSRSVMFSHAIIDTLSNVTQLESGTPQLELTP